MSSRRLARLNEQFRREITAIMHRAVRDPRVRNIVVNSVEVTSDLWLARVYVRVGGEGKERTDALEGLEAASSFIRRELAAELRIHRIPDLRFLEDKALAQATRIEEILESLDTSPDDTHDTDDEQGEADGSRDNSDGSGGKSR